MNDDTDADSCRKALATELLTARLAVGLTGRRAATAAGMSQSKLSKIENGRIERPKPADVAALATVYRVTPEACKRLVALAERIVRESHH